jgi:hypothetical protein
MQDDFYMSILDWSSQDFLSVALDASVYILNVDTYQARRKNLLKILQNMSLTHSPDIEVV